MNPFCSSPFSNIFPSPNQSNPRISVWIDTSYLSLMKNGHLCLNLTYPPAPSPSDRHFKILHSFFRQLQVKSFPYMELKLSPVEPDYLTEFMITLSIQNFISLLVSSDLNPFLVPSDLNPVLTKH